MNERREYIQDDGQLRVFIVPVDILDEPDLSSSEKLVYIVLRSYVNPTDPSAFPSYETIAKKASLSRRRVIDIVKSLEEKQLIKKEIRMTVTKDRKIKNTSNLYTLVTPKRRVAASETISPPPVKPFHQGSEIISPYHNHLKEPLLNNDDDNALTRDAINHLVFKEFKEQITAEQFAKVIQRIPARKKTIDYQAYLAKCVQTEIEELNRKASEQAMSQQAAAQEKPRTKTKRSPKKSKIDIITPDSNKNAPVVDDESFAEMMRFAQEIQSGRVVRRTELP